MSSPNDPDDKDREQRLAAIQALTRTSPTPPAATHTQNQRAFAPTTSVGHRRAFTWASIFALILALNVVIYLFTAHIPALSSHKDKSQSLTVIQFPEGHLGCALNSTWAPGGKSIAIVGYRLCSTQDGVIQGLHPVVSIFDPVAGREMATLPLESALVRDVTHGADLGTYQLTLGSAVWNASGQTIGVMFSLTPDAHPDQVLMGLAVLPLSGSTHAIVPTTSLGQPGVTYDTYNLYTTVPPLSVRFDTATNSVSTATPTQSLFYTWDNSRGTLTPRQQLDAQAAQLPSTISGSVQYVCASSTDATAHGNSAYFWMSAGGSSWSPDGRYFFSTLGAFGRLADTPKPATSGVSDASQQSCLVAGTPTKWTVIHMPLQGFAGAERQLTPDGLTQFTFVTSPDNTKISVSEMLNGDSSALTAPEQIIAVYNAATGASVARLRASDILKQAHITTQHGGEVFPAMSWSPDARYLALTDTADRALLILGPAQLR